MPKAESSAKIGGSSATPPSEREKNRETQAKPPAQSELRSDGKLKHAPPRTANGQTSDAGGFMPLGRMLIILIGGQNLARCTMYFATYSLNTHGLVIDRRAKFSPPCCFSHARLGGDVRQGVPF